MKTVVLTITRVFAFLCLVAQMRSVVAGLLLAFVSVSLAEFAPTIVFPDTPVLVASQGTSSLYSIGAAGYDDPILLVDLHGSSRYELGYAYGYLLANQSAANYAALMNYLSKDALVQEVVELFMDYEYEQFLGKHLPAAFVEESNGLAAGGKDAGQPNLGQ
jgi:hypothetical protein